jgi:single-stranded-DNA-specific exonuclease
MRSLDPARADLLARELGVLPLTARLLAVRDLPDSDSARAFLAPTLATLLDPFLMDGMDLAVERIAHAVRRKEPIAIYGDYDVDGLTATALLTRFFGALGTEVGSYIPHRLDEGYGMSVQGIETLQSRGTRLVITVDNGIGCFDEVHHARGLGMDVVVTDHHQPEGRTPEAAAVVNPNRADCPYPFKSLCGCGVAFKLAHALARHMGLDAAQAKPLLFSLLDLVALGTVADVMPLTGENRPLVRHGLRELEKTTKPGLRALAAMLGLGDKPFSPETVAFMLAPRLNAAGRTGNATDALELLLTESESRAWELAKYLDHLNQERRNIESDVLEEALAQLEEDPTPAEELPVLVVAGQGWHPGVVGIVASRLVDRYGRPAVVLGIEGDTARGSARSIEGFDLLGALTRCSDVLGEFGGHRMAAGLSLPAARFEEFRDALRHHVADMLEPDSLKPRLDVDTHAEVSDLTMASLKEIDGLRPFGQGNPAPVVALENCRLVGEPVEVGGKHLKMRLWQQSENGSGGGGSGGSGGGSAGDALTAIWFRCPLTREEVAAWVRSQRPFAVAGSPRINTWNGVQSVEFSVQDIRLEA